MAKKRNEQDYLQQWYCPQTQKIHIVDIKNPFCPHCKRIHKFGYYVPGANVEYYRTQDCWYLSSFFAPDPRGREN